jgi:hypothetical protein
MTAKKRILLAEVTPRIRQSPVNAAISATDKDSTISVTSLSGVYVVSKPTIAAGWGAARCSLGLRFGVWYWETQYTYTGVGDVCCGIAGPSAPLNIRPGTGLTFPSGGSASLSGPDKAGDCKYGGITLVNVGAVTSGAVVRHWLDLDAGKYSVAVNGGAWSTVLLNSALLGSEALGQVHPIVALSHAGGTCTCSVNFGGAPFAFPIPEGANPGVYTTPASVSTTQYLSSSAMNTGPLDTPANTGYLARIAANQDIEIEREGSCWVWGGQSISRRGQLVVVNNDGRLDGWAAYDWRDATINLFAGFEGDGRGAFTLWSSTTVDTVELAKDNRIILHLTDPLAFYDRAVQPALYPDTQPNSGVAHQPVPFVIGRPLYCSGVLLDTNPTVRDHQLHDAAVVGGYTSGLGSIEQVFDKGDVFAGPADPYVAHNPITTANGGAFTTWANDAGGVSMPASFTRITAFGATNDRFQQGAATANLRMLSSGQMLTAIFHSATIQANYRYTIAFNVIAVGIAGSITFRCAITGQIVDATIAISTTGAKTLTIDTPAGASQMQIVLGVLGSQCDITIDNLTVSSVQIVDWTYKNNGSGDHIGFHLANAPDGKVVANPVGVTNEKTGLVVESLGDALDYLLARGWSAYGGAPTPPVVDTSTAPIEAQAPYRIARYVDKPVTDLSLMREVVDSWCGWIVPKRDGALVVGRVTAPSLTASLVLDQTNVSGNITIGLDEAKNLTLRLGGRRNHSPHADSDIAGSVSPSLKAELTAELTLVRAGAAPLGTDAISVAYAQAIAAPPKATWIQDASGLQAESNRVATLWRPSRYFYSVTALLTASAADALEPGQTVRLVWPRYGLKDGKNLLVVGVRSRFFSRRVDLKLWG